MSSSIDSKSKVSAKRALMYLIITIIKALFGGIYELFGHGVYSYYMLYAFAIPLACGALPNLIAATRELPLPCRAANNLYNSGVATLTVGCVFQGVLEIYGTTNRLVYIYLLVGGSFLISGLLTHIFYKAHRKRS